MDRHLFKLYGSFEINKDIFNPLYISNKCIKAVNDKITLLSIKIDGSIKINSTPPPQKKK